MRAVATSFLAPRLYQDVSVASLRTRPPASQGDARATLECIETNKRNTSNGYDFEVETQSGCGRRRRGSVSRETPGSVWSLHEGDEGIETTSPEVRNTATSPAEIFAKVMRNDMPLLPSSTLVALTRLPPKIRLCRTAPSCRRW